MAVVNRRFFPEFQYDAWGTVNPSSQLVYQVCPVQATRTACRPTRIHMVKGAGLILEDLKIGLESQVIGEVPLEVFIHELAGFHLPTLEVGTMMTFTLQNPSSKPIDFALILEGDFRTW
jgi:hypothetical protein